VDVSAANPGIRKLYALVSEGSASASEGLLVGLAPYLDIVTIGTRTHGKYCGGYLLAPDEFYTKDYYQQNLSKFSLIEKWGIYVMVSKFADRDGKNAAEPDGILPDIAVTDNPFDGYPLGDENETLLKAALIAAGKTYTRADGSSRPVYVRTERLHHKPNILIHSRKPVEFKQP
jgi:C-terminal processing protease CtpA/Prc